MSELESKIVCYESPEFYGLGSTCLLVASHRMYDNHPSAHVCQITGILGEDGRLTFRCEFTVIRYIGSDELLRDMGETDSVQFIECEATDWAKRSLLSVILSHCRSTNLIPPSGPKTAPTEWRRCVRLMRLRGLSEAAMDRIANFIPDAEFRDFMKQAKHIEPLKFERQTAP